MMSTVTEHFGWFNYVLFVLMLVVSAGIGVYFGFIEKQKTTEDYILGGRIMGSFPVGVSLIASSISGYTLIGVPSEVYIHGFIHSLECFSGIICGLIVHYVYLPVFFKLQLTSSYEYLELRFNEHVRKMASSLFFISMLSITPITIYAPSLAFAYASGVSVHLVSPVVCVVCIFYTTLGGMKAVIWTDVVQGFVIVATSLVVIILGVINVGGIGTVFQRSLDGGRLELAQFDASPFKRNTVWTVVIGFSFMFVANMGVSQHYVQKFLSTRSLAAARRSLLYFVFGSIFTGTLSSLTGLIIYATYYDCDPVKSKSIQRPDQLIPFFIMDTASKIPGLPGLFIAGVFSASLSTMSTALNALSATVYEDFVKPFLKGRRMLESTTNVMMKMIVVIVGVICVLLVFVVEQLGAVLELMFSVVAITAGTLLGLISLGMFFPWANAKGAFAGSISSMLLIGWMVIGAQNSARKGQLPHPWLPTSVEGCDNNVTDAGVFHLNTTSARDDFTMINSGDFNISSVIAPHHSHGNGQVEPPFFLYRIAFYYFGVIGPLWVVVVGLVVSFLTGKQDPNALSRDLFVTFAHKYVNFAQVDKPDPSELEHLTRNEKEMKVAIAMRVFSRREKM